MQVATFPLGVTTPLFKIFNFFIIFLCAFNDFLKTIALFDLIYFLIYLSLS